MDEAKRLIDRLKQTGVTLATAESCTGGLLGKLLTDVPGASEVYLGGMISYAYRIKEELLGVDPQLLQKKGAVCEEVAGQMAQGARERMHADLALSATGNAGPGADEKNPNVGEIYIACAGKEGTVCEKLLLSGSRAENREETCRRAICLAEAYLRMNY